MESLGQENSDRGRCTPQPMDDPEQTLQDFHNTTRRLKDELNQREALILRLQAMLRYKEDQSLNWVAGSVFCLILGITFYTTPTMTEGKTLGVVMWVFGAFLMTRDLIRQVRGPK